MAAITIKGVAAPEQTPESCMPAATSWTEQYSLMQHVACQLHHVVPDILDVVKKRGALLCSFMLHRLTGKRSLQQCTTTTCDKCRTALPACLRCCIFCRPTLRELPDTNLGKIEAKVNVRPSSSTPLTSLLNCSAAGICSFSSARAMPAKPNMAIRPLRRCRKGKGRRTST